MECAGDDGAWDLPAKLCTLRIQSAVAASLCRRTPKPETTDHSIAAENDHGIGAFELFQFGVVSLLDFEVVRWWVAPTRRTKEPDLAALGINEFTVAALGLHFKQTLLDRDVSSGTLAVDDDLI